MILVEARDSTKLPVQKLGDGRVLLEHTFPSRIILDLKTPIHPPGWNVLRCLINSLTLVIKFNYQLIIRFSVHTRIQRKERKERLYAESLRKSLASRINEIPKTLLSNGKGGGQGLQADGRIKVHVK